MRKSQANYFKNIIPRGLCTEFIYLEMEGGKYYRWKNMRKGITKYHFNLPHYRFPPASTEPFDTQENSHIIKPTSQNNILDLKFPTYPATMIQTFRSTCTDFSVEVSHMRKWAMRGATISGNSRHISLQWQQQRWPNQVLAERGQQLGSISRFVQCGRRMSVPRGGWGVLPGNLTLSLVLQHSSEILS